MKSLQRGRVNTRLGEYILGKDTDDVIHLGNRGGRGGKVGEEEEEGVWNLFACVCQ